MTPETITIQSLKKKGKLYHLSFPNDDEVHKIHPEIHFKYHLSADSALSPQEWRAILDENELKRAEDQALNLLTVRMHSEGELRAKLYKKGFSSRAINQTINRCKELGFINDAQFVNLYTEELRARGYGPLKIRNSLARKRIPRELIDRYLEDDRDNHDDTEQIRNAIERKMKLLKRESDPRKQREKLIRHLAGKGFYSGAVFTAVNAYFANDK